MFTINQNRCSRSARITVHVRPEYALTINGEINADIPTLVLGYMIKNRLGQEIYGTNTWHTEQAVEDLKKGQKIEYNIHFTMNFGPGSYSVSTALVSSDTHLLNNYEWQDLAILFEVINVDKTTFVGCAWNEPVIEIRQ